MSRLVFLCVAGAAGTITRYGLDGWIYKLTGEGFPYGTLVVNVIGCFVIGLLGTLADERFFFGSQFRQVVFLGFLGAFTTFSSFAYETWVLAKDGEFLRAVLNVAANVGGGGVSLFGGVFAARSI